MELVRRVSLLALLIIISIILILTYTPDSRITTNKYKLVLNTPAGLAYNGKPTKAILAYYCVKEAKIANNGIMDYTYTPIRDGLRGYSIQLNALLSNGLWLQDAVVNGYLEEMVWNMSFPEPTPLSEWATPLAFKCGWLAIRIRNDYAYFGYSPNGWLFYWYFRYRVGNVSILASPLTNIALGGPGSSEGVSFRQLLVVLALWYWGNDSWHPASANPYPSTGEFVHIAYASYSNNYIIISYPNRVNSSWIPNIS